MSLSPAAVGGERLSVEAKWVTARNTLCRAVPQPRGLALLSVGGRKPQLEE